MLKNIFKSNTSKPNKKILLSGIQSSGQLHIGNYFGAIKQNINLANSSEYENFIFIANYHSMTSSFNKEDRIKSSLEIAAAYLALGLDTKKTALFLQSDVPLNTELSWILSTVTPTSMMDLAHSYKDKVANNISANLGLYSYPVLMAADILLYNADLVPVGKDQEQHLEYAREIAGKFNRAYGEFFNMPQAYIMPEVAVVPGTDGSKMSKSKGNVIPLFASDDSIKKTVMNIVTDSARPEGKKDPDTNNIYLIHKLFLNKEQDLELRNKFTNGGYGYKEAKDNLLKDILNFISPYREKYDYLMSHPEIILKELEEGKIKAAQLASQNMMEIKNMTGLNLK